VTIRQGLTTPYNHTRRDGKRYCGGQAIELPTDQITVKVYGEPHLLQTATVARNLKLTIRLGDPVVVELSGSSGYSVAALHDGQFADAGPQGSQEASVARGDFHASRIMDAFID
jgi:hypothetical protein